MNTETIIKITVTDNNELLLLLASNGNPMYQYVYREAAGVYWDNHQKGFKSTALKEWTISKWFEHIRNIVFSCLQVHLKIGENAIWENIPEEERIKIKTIDNSNAGSSANS